MRFIDLIAKLDTLCNELTIYVKAEPEIHYLSPAIACVEPKDGNLPPEAKGMKCLLEVELAKEVLIVWKEWRSGDKRGNPRPAEACDAIVYYAENDAYIPIAESRFKINGLVLPKKLQELIEQGRWIIPADLNRLREIAGPIEDGARTYFLNPESMHMESDYHHLLMLVDDEKMADIYGLTSSKISGKSIEDNRFIDIDLAIMIAVNYDEQAIWLDFRSSMMNPRIIFQTFISETSPQRALEIAPDIETFAKMLDL